MRNFRPGSEHSCRAWRNRAGSLAANVRVETRWAGDKADDIHKYAAELVALAPDVILAQGATTAADPHRTDRVSDRRRSGRRRFSRQFGAAGRQRHRIYDYRIQLW